MSITLSLLRALPGLAAIATGCLPLGDLDKASSGSAMGGDAGPETGGLSGTTDDRAAAGGLSSAAAGTGGIASALAGAGGVPPPLAGAGGAPPPLAGAGGISSGAGSNGVCGDLSVDRESDEECDTGGIPTLECDPDCRLALCDDTCLCELIDGQRYMFCEDKVRVVAAEICNENRMGLVQIESASVNMALRDYASRQGLNYLWIGARDREANGEWLWENGQPVDESAENGEGLSAWASNEPSEGNRCAVIDEKGDWRAVPCGDVHDFVCELSLEL